MQAKFGCPSLVLSTKVKVGSESFVPISIQAYQGLGNHIDTVTSNVEYGLMQTVVLSARTASTTALITSAGSGCPQIPLSTDPPYSSIRSLDTDFKDRWSSH